MTPLRIEAEMAARVIMPPEGYIHLDALLIAAEAKRLGLPPLLTMRAMAEAPYVPIPIRRSACGRFYLCSASERVTPSAYESRWINKRFPVQEAIALGGSKFKRIDQSSGLAKAFRYPVEAQHIERLTWWALGQIEDVRELLQFITRLGRRRAAGEGLVREWHCEPCEPWAGGGFPVLRGGRPMRHLPVDLEGLDAESSVREGRLRAPYQCRIGEEVIACP